MGHCGKRFLKEFFFTIKSSFQVPSGLAGVYAGAVEIVLQQILWVSYWAQTISMRWCETVPLLTAISVVLLPWSLLGRVEGSLLLGYQS